MNGDGSASPVAVAGIWSRRGSGVVNGVAEPISQLHDGGVLLALVANRENATNAELVRAGGDAWLCVTPAEAVRWLGAGDVALGRLDVLPGLDGIDGGLQSLGELEARGVRVLNPASALIAAHDKLVTARLLRRAGLPHPRTWSVSRGSSIPAVTGPAVIKPRFGSWGRDVVRCGGLDDVHRQLQAFASRNWYGTRGALVQELVEPRGYDLRVLVAGGRVAGAIRRVAAPGEWRTNVALGARREAVVPPRDACRLALASAAAAGADLVGVDLLPVEEGWTVLELNGAVEFTREYSSTDDVFASVARRLERLAHAPARDEPLELWS